MSGNSGIRGEVYRARVTAVTPLAGAARGCESRAPVAPLGGLCELSAHACCAPARRRPARRLQTPAGRTPPGIAEARRLQSQASDEFNKGNYGGALYLANQSKVATGTGRAALASGSAASLRQGEVLFALPLQLQTTGRANVREGPGAGFHVAFTLEAGVSVM